MPYSELDTPTVFVIGEFEALGGVRQILTEYTQGVSSTVYYDMPVGFILTDVVSGTRDVYNELYVATTGTLGDASLSEYVELFVSSSGDLGSDVRSITDDFTVGGIPAGVYGGTDIAAEYIQGHIVSPSGIGEDVDVEWVMPATFNTQIDEDVEFTISTSQLYDYDVDVYSSTYSGTAVTVGGSWYDGAWSYRIKIEVDYTLVPGNLTNFPLAVKIDSANNVFTEAQSNGYDILFTESNGTTKLDHELSVFDDTGELLIAYVSTDLSSTVNTEIYMYYGNPSAPDQSDPDAAWDSDFDAVWHFEDGTYTGAANEVHDSSGSGNHGRRGSGNFQGFDSTWGQALNITDSDDWMRFESNLNINAEYTISCLFWIPLSNSTSWHTLTRGSQYHQIILTNAHVLGNYQSGFHSSGFDMDTLGAGLHHVAVVRLGGGTGDFYVDGTFVGNAALQPQDDIYAVGNYQGNGQHWGRIDEFRVSASTGRSANWIETEYQNLLNYSNFLTFFPEETVEVIWELDDYVDSEIATVNSGTGEGGYLWPFPSDVYSTASGSRHPMETDLYVSLANTVPSGQVFKSPEVWPVASGYYFGGEVTTSGALTGYAQDVYVSLESLISGSNQNTYRTDMRLHALEVDNFFLEVDEYTTAAGVMSVDVYDKRRIPISTSGTYFVVSGTQVPVTFSGIEVPLIDRGQPIVASGYRMFFDSPTDFYADEPLEIVAHGANIIGDVIEQTYYLLYGYNLIYDTPPEVVWGWGDQIIVWATAKNKASCPTQSTDAWWFEIRPKEYADLGATIVPTGYANLPATIYPQLQPNSFFYGAKVTVVVRAKDEAGNEMEPFVLNFTIEDNPN